MKRKPTFTTSLGSISGLDPTEDPIGDLAYTLRQLLKTCRVDREVRKAHIELLRTYEEFNDADHMAEKFCNALEHYAPPYAFFGTQENDYGETVYGFWPQNIDDLDREGHLVKLTDYHDEHELRCLWGRDVVKVNDHGNVECGRFDKRGRWHEYWSCV